MGVKFFYRNIDLVYFVNNKLINNNLITQKDRMLLSFSGGQDSICFVFILNQLYSQLEFDITFFWCHHLWQTDSFYVMQQITKLSFLLQFDSCFPIPLNSISSELLARKWRQRCSYRVSLFYNYSKICLAHTVNDKVENIFLNFIRGTGLIGLAPLRWTQFISKSNITNKKHLSCFTSSYALPFQGTEESPVRAFSERAAGGMRIHFSGATKARLEVSTGVTNDYKAKSCRAFTSSLCTSKRDNRSSATLPTPNSIPSSFTPSCALPFQGTGESPYRVRKSKICKGYASELRLNEFAKGNIIHSCSSVALKHGKQLLNCGKDCYIVRPLLSISRIELNKICYFWKLPIYPDKSNQKVKFFRNRVRGQLLPTIKLFFNLNIENIFLQLAKIIETEDYCLTQIVNEFTKNTDVYHTKLNIYSKKK